MTISLVSVFKYYQQFPHQTKALEYLQQELAKTNPELLDNSSEFINIWRQPDPTPGRVVQNINLQATKTETRLNVPYLSQIDNINNPHGSCNVTSLAMCMGFYGRPLITAAGKQLEDELYEYCLDNGLSRHSPLDLAKVLQAYGYKDNFQPGAKWGEVKQWLAAGKPCIVHGWFTKSGHIIVIVGYNEQGWIVNDPYGEWFDWGYDTTISGKGLTYSYEMMQRLCGPDGDLWMHYVSK